MESNFESRILLCASCNEEFAFTVEAQDYFAQKGLVDDPQMCKSCYTESKRGKRSQSAEQNSSHGEVDNNRIASNAGNSINGNSINGNSFNGNSGSNGKNVK